MLRSLLQSFSLSLLVVSCGGAVPPKPVAPQPASANLLATETPFLSELRQLTFGGENAEAYWSFEGNELSFQARGIQAANQPANNDGCDRIYRMSFPGGVIQPVSSGKGATTCAHFFPFGGLLFASTHLAGDACPPKPDMSQGYVWALHDSYDIFRAAPDGSDLRQLTTTPGYDAEGTVCGKDGSIIFTSTRDGDIDLYRMDADGKNVRRLTHEVGYDGGAFFNRDCTKIVWRASRPRPGKETDDYKALLARNLVKPSRLELWIADADGTNPMQLTYLNAASFAPSFHPTQDLIVFSSNYGDPKGREFDLWMIKTNGAGMTRITQAPGFDGFPHFSPDGTWLAFSSNRATAPGKHDTNVFVGKWHGQPVVHEEAAADRVARDVDWLAAPEREGRGVGTAGLTAAGAFIEQRLRALGLEPAGDDGGFRQYFSIVTKTEIGASSRVELAGKALPHGDFSVLGFSSVGAADGVLALAGYGIVDATAGIDDYAHADVRNKIAVVRRFAPELSGAPPGTQARLGDLRRKAWLAREHGAKALLVVDWPAPPVPRPPEWEPASEAPLLPPTPEGSGDAGIPILMIKRLAIEPLAERLLAGQQVEAKISAALEYHRTRAFNLLGRIRAGRPPGGGAVIVGAHYDHLGHGGTGSLAPDKHEIHRGADDNASGTATVLEIARAFAARRGDLSHDVLIALFSGEEAGLLGSGQLVRAHADLVNQTMAMLNLDMVGRLRSNRLEVLGIETATEWPTLVTAACDAETLGCAPSSDGFGASDQASFYGAGVPVLHFFTGTHGDYHKPSDTPDKINAAGASAVARLTERLVSALERTPKLSYHKATMTPTRGDQRTFNASLGTMPDYAGPPAGQPGVLLAGVRTGGAAEKGGLRRGDILVRLGQHEIRSVQDLGFALSALKPGMTITAVVLRDGKRHELPVVLQEARGPR